MRLTWLTFHKNFPSTSLKNIFPKPFKKSSFLPNIRFFSKIERTLPPAIRKKQPPQLPLPLREKHDNSWAEWFTTDKGREVSLILSMAVGTALAGWGFITTTVCPGVVQDYYSEMKSDVNSNFTEIMGRLETGDSKGVVATPRELDKIFGSQWQRAGLSPLEHERLAAFPGVLMDPVVIGTTCKNGGSIGVPRHMMWTSEEEMQLDTVTFKPCLNKFFKGYKIPSAVEPEDLEELKCSLLLSPEARNFIVSKCMAKANDYSYIPEIVANPFFVFVHYFGGLQINKKFKLFDKTLTPKIRYYRLGIQAYWACLILVGTLVFHNLLNQDMHTAAINQVVHSVEEAEAAIEYYSKVIRRNKILRKILGPESHYYIEEDGNLVAHIYEMSSYTSLTTHLGLVEEMKAKYEAIRRGSGRGKLDSSEEK